MPLFQISAILSGASIQSLQFLADGTTSGGLADFMLSTMVYILAGIAICLLISKVFKAREERDAALEQLNRKEDEQFASLSNEWIRNKKQLAQLERAKQDLETAKQKQLDELAAREREVEKRCKSFTTAIQTAELKRTPPSKAQFEEGSRAIRAEQFVKSGSSQEIQVKCFLDPLCSGSIVFEWQSLLTGPVSPTLVVYRNDVEIHRESGSFEGRLPYLLLRPSKRNYFEFIVFDGMRQYPNHLGMEVIIPPFIAWPMASKSAKPKPRNPAKSKERWIADNVAKIKRLNQWPKGEKAQNDLMARLQAEALEKFGEAE